MKSFLMNNNLSLDSFLKRMIGKKRGLVVARTIEKAILIFGREEVPSYNKNKMPAEQ
jgi:hypothetical protein